MYVGDVFKAKMPATATSESHYCTCLGHLGWRNTNRIVSIGQGMQGRHGIMDNIASVIGLNFANVNMG